MSLEEVAQAIKNLSDNDGIGVPSSSHKLNKIGDKGDRCQNSGAKSSHNGRKFFSCEDTLLTKDIVVEIEGVGELCLPINEKFIQDVIKISSKAKFGRGEETLIDTSVRDTQTIPASKLKVTINEQSLSAVLNRISLGLNIGKGSTIKPYLYNMLIYGPGQFFKKHQDSEKMPHMIATLVIVLPSVHKGGDLIIEHNDYKHTFFGSQNPSIAKCIAFYSDCRHEIEKVIEGYRVALTYNVVLEYSDISDNLFIYKNLDIAVANYFDGKDRSDRLVYLLNHSYTENNLKWSTLKGTDRTDANALFAVAKKQGRLPYLALADYEETVHFDERSGRIGYDSLFSNAEPYFWVDEHNVSLDRSSFDVHNDWFQNSFSDHEICRTTKTAKLFQPYKEQRNRYTGNEGADCNQWYKRACVVIFCSKWVFLEGYKAVINEFYQLTTQKGNEDRLLEEINKAGDDFMKYKFWRDPSVAEMLIKIVIYLNDKEKAILIMSQIPRQLLLVDKLQLFLQLESQFDLDTWSEVLQNWSKGTGQKKYFCSKDLWQKTLDNAVPFIEAYKHVATKKDIFNFLINSNWSTLRGYKLALNELYQLTTETGHVEQLIEKINSAGKNFFNYNHWSDPPVTDMLLKIVVYLNNQKMAESILCHLLTHLFVVEKIEALIELGDQYSSYMWSDVTSNRRTLLDYDKKFRAEYSKMPMNDLVKFIDKFYCMAPDSVLVDYFIDDIVAMYYSKASNMNPKVSKKFLQNKINVLVGEFCLLLKTCIKANLLEPELYLIHATLPFFQPLNQAEILFKLQEDLDPDDFIKCKRLWDHIIIHFDKKLKEIDPNSWEVPFVLKCRCKFCKMVNVFLKSPESSNIKIAAPEDTRKHIFDNLFKIEDLKDLIKTDLEKKGSPHKLIIDKQRKVLTDRQNFIEELKVCRTKLQCINFTDHLQLVKTEKESSLGNKTTPQENIEILNSKSTEVEDVPLALRIKTEPRDNIEFQNDDQHEKAVTRDKTESGDSMKRPRHQRKEGTSSVKIKECLSSSEYLGDFKTEPVEATSDCDGKTNISPKRKRMTKR